MKYFGTVKTFDTIKGHGEIKQEAGGNDLPFEKGAIAWDKNVAPTVGPAPQLRPRDQHGPAGLRAEPSDHLTERAGARCFRLVL